MFLTVFDDFEGHLGAIWGHVGAMLGPSWAILGPSWGHLGAMFGHLGASWGQNGQNVDFTKYCCWFLLVHLEASWGHLGAILGPSGGHLGALFCQRSWVIWPKNKQKRQFYLVFLTVFQTHSEKLPFLSKTPSWGCLKVIMGPPPKHSQKH